MAVGCCVPGDDRNVTESPDGGIVNDPGAASSCTDGRHLALSFDALTAIVAQMARRHRSERNGGIDGDKSPKSKQRGQKQKDVARASGAADAKAKQDSQNRAPASAGKGRK